MGFIGELKFINVVKGYAKIKAISTGRRYNGFFFKINGESVYNFENEEIVFKKGTVIYLPRGSKYIKTLVSNGKSEYISVNFDGEPIMDTPFLFTGINTDYLIERFNLLYNLQARSDKSSVYKCRSVLYDIIAYLTETAEKGRESDLIKKIKPSFDYLHENIYNSDLQVDTLGEISGVSDAYFRSIFKKVIGVSPKKYVTEKRMEFAKTMLDDGYFDKIYDVAAASGFSDSLYFGKVFKESYGISPKKYMENIKK